MQCINNTFQLANRQYARGAATEIDGLDWMVLLAAPLPHLHDKGINIGRQASLCPYRLRIESAVSALAVTEWNVNVNHFLVLAF